MTSLRLDDPTGSVADAVLVYDYPLTKVVYLNLRVKRLLVLVGEAGGMFCFELIDGKSIARLAKVVVDVGDRVETGWHATVDVSRGEVFIFLFRITREDLDAGKRATT